MPMFGPDMDQVTMDFDQAFELVMPARFIVLATFSVEAAWENAVVIQYTSHPSGRSLPSPVFKGNMNRDLMRHEIIGPYDGDPDLILISAWHKKGGPSGALPWYQNKMRVQTKANITQLHFEDNTDEDFNDIIVTLETFKP